MTNALFMENGNDAFLYFEGPSSDLNDGTTVCIGAGDASGSAGTEAASVAFGGSPMISFNDLVLFDGVSGGTSNLQVYNQTTGATTALKVAGAAKTGLDPQDFVQDGSEVYFVGQDVKGYRSLWETNGTASGTKELVPVGFSAVVDSGQMAVLNGNLWFNWGGYLTEYSSNGNFNAIEGYGTTPNPYGIPLNPYDMISAKVGNASGATTDDLFFNGGGTLGANNQIAGGGLWVSNGSSATEIGAGLDPTDLTTLTYTNNKGQQITDVFFNGIKPFNESNLRGQSELYMVTEGAGPGGVSAPVEIGASSQAYSALNPQDITACNGKLYFAGSESASYVSGGSSPNDSNPQGLFVYDPNAGGSASLVDSSNKGYVGLNNYDLDVGQNTPGPTTANPQAQISTINDCLYFTANCGGTTGGLFIYDTVTHEMTNHVTGTANGNNYNLASVTV